MLKTLLTVFVVAGGVSLSSAQTAKFDKEIIDYGNVKKGTNKEKIFKVTNTGDKPLILNDVTAQCGCTIPSYPKQPILPGKSADIKVTYDTNRVGSFNKTITVMSNDTKVGRKVLTIKGTVL